MLLRSQMAQLVKRIHELSRDQEHWEICRIVATEFDLWTNDNFPSWLSRVVEGCQRDAWEGWTHP